MPSPQGTAPLQTSPSPSPLPTRGKRVQGSSRQHDANEGAVDNLPHSEGFPRQWRDVMYTRRTYNDNGQVVQFEDEEDDDEYGNGWTKLGNDGRIMQGFESDNYAGDHHPSPAKLRRDPGSLLAKGAGDASNARGDGMALMRNRVQQSAAQSHYQNLYQSMRHKDKLVDKV